MALTKYREPNMVKWVGSRPAHNGEQVLGYAYQGGAGGIIIYTVTAAKTLYLTYLSMASRESVAASADTDITVYDTTPAVWKRLMYHLYDIAGQQQGVISFNPPIEIPSLYTIRIGSGHANIDTNCVIAGWEE